MTVLGWIFAVPCIFAVLAFLNWVAKTLMGVDEWSEFRRKPKEQEPEPNYYSSGFSFGGPVEVKITVDGEVKVDHTDPNDNGETKS